MQIPAWQFLGCILIAAVWHDMASLLRSTFRRYITSSPPSFSPTTYLSKPASSFHSTAAMSSPSSSFISALAARRSNYALTSSSPIPDTQIQEIINQVILHVPSSFNSQSTRIILLLKNEHEKIWDITRDVLKEIVPAEQFPKTEAKMGSFKAAYGTVSSSRRCSLSPQKKKT